jgi:hypothetical protein
VPIAVTTGVPATTVNRFAAVAVSVPVVTITLLAPVAALAAIVIVAVRWVGSVTEMLLAVTPLLPNDTVEPVPKCVYWPVINTLFST